MICIDSACHISNGCLTLIHLVASGVPAKWNQSQRPKPVPTQTQWHGRGLIDLSKAFDTINHDILLKKLNFYGIRGVPNSWFANYLSNRKQFTEINNCKSALTNISTGVPQGSILGPILFLLYINDINNCTSLNLLSFADDTTIYRSGPYNKELFDEVNYELIKIHTLLCTNKLSLNVKKSKVCIFSPPNSRYTLGNNCISVNNVKINFIDQ